MTKRINAPDTEADIKLRACLDKSPRVSFNMIAGAGSGKTTSLVKALNHIITTKGDALRRQGQQVACITYTEIAAKEIWDDVGNNTLVHVSTIHSFLWSVIRPFQKDIKKWVLSNITLRITNLETTIADYGARVQQRTKDKDAKKLEKLKSEALFINEVSYFNYGTGSNYLKGILGHDDIVKLVPAMIQDRAMLNTIISQKFPYIFVDESQDTFPDIVSALKKVDKDHSGKFCLGFFGDPMQKIYPTGVGDIPAEVGWAIIKKPENFRCSKRVLDLINLIRKQSDGLQQTGGRVENVEGKPAPVKGSAQIFILPSDDHRKENLQRVKGWCSKKFDDDSWNDDSKIKIFVIVHRMAAIRLGFPNLYSAMNDDAPSSFNDGFLDGTSWPLKPFLNFILALVQKNNEGQKFEVLTIARANSPKLMGENLKSPELPKNMKTIKQAIDALSDMMKDDSNATVLDVFRHIQGSELAVLDSRIVNHMNDAVKSEEDLEGEEEPAAIEIASMKKYFTCPAKELWGYKKYFESESPFATQQGVKGAQFDRVLTILDDEEGTHRQFSYDKYFGVAALSNTDELNIAQGKDSVIERTRRLFYVSCSRAKRELVVIYYTGNVGNAVEKVMEMGIFPEEDILTINNLQ
jgi:DNA helicase-2/ATP-dependent DNA helicase PcrA